MFDRLAVRGVEPVIERLFKPAGKLVDSLLCRFERRLGAEEIELDIAGVSQNGCLNILVGGVDGSENLVGLRLGDHGRAQGTLGDVALRNNLLQPRQTFGVEERLAL